MSVNVVCMCIFVLFCINYKNILFLVEMSFYNVIDFILFVYSNTNLQSYNFTINKMCLIR